MSAFFVRGESGVKHFKWSEVLSQVWKKGAVNTHDFVGQTGRVSTVTNGRKLCLKDSQSDNLPKEPGCVFCSPNLKLNAIVQGCLATPVPCTLRPISSWGWSTVKCPFIWFKNMVICINCPNSSGILRHKVVCCLFSFTCH